MAEKSAGFAAFDKGRIRTVLRFAQSTVGQVMVPMAEVTAINAAHSMAEAISKSRASNINRLPIYKGIASNVIGVACLDSWDLMDLSLDNKPLEAVTHPA
jgi:CBS domain containing-hemolysin-like protein